MMNKILSFLLLAVFVMMAAPVAATDADETPALRATDFDNNRLHGEDLRQAWLELDDEAFETLTKDNFKSPAQLRQEISEMSHEELHERRLWGCGTYCSCCGASWCCTFCGWGC